MRIVRRQLALDLPAGRSAFVSLEKEPRRLERDVEVLPWRGFVELLWAGKLVS